MAELTESAGVTTVGEPGRGTAQLYAGTGGTGGLGKVIAVNDGTIVFAPAGSNYEMHLLAPKYAGSMNAPVRGTVRVTARKIWTVPSGGNFISPIFGPPRIIQGRVKAIEPKQLIVHASCPIWVNLPDNDIVYDLANGPIRVGAMVNVTALPGATFELAV